MSVENELFKIRNPELLITCGRGTFPDSEEISPKYRGQKLGFYLTTKRNIRLLDGTLLTGSDREYALGEIQRKFKE